MKYIFIPAFNGVTQCVREELRNENLFVNVAREVDFTPRVAYEQSGGSAVLLTVADLGFCSASSPRP